MSEKDRIEEISNKRCFIITPIGEINSEIFRKAKGVIDSVIKPVLLKYGFTDIKPSYEIMESGMIGNQIIDRIINDDLVVANLTGNNPNVMYELAIRHVTAKPVIHICEKGTILPFDIKDNRTAFFNDDMLGVQELQNDFEEFVRNIDYSFEYKDNPIYGGIQMANLLKEMNDGGRQTEAELLQKILDKISEAPLNRKRTSRNANVHIDNILNEADFSLTIRECPEEKMPEVLNALKKDMFKVGVRLIGTYGMKICFCNRLNVDFADISKIISDIELKYQVSIFIDDIDLRAIFLDDLIKQGIKVERLT